MVDHLSKAESGAFRFPSYQQMFPNIDFSFGKQLREHLRYYGYRLLHHKQCAQLVDFLNENPQWQPLFTQNFYRFNSLLMTYCDKRFSVQERLNAITQNLTVAKQKWGKAFCGQLLESGSIKLAQLTEELHLSLNLNQIDPFEGYFSINIKNAQNERIYDASFTFLNAEQLLIASIQGPNHEQAQGSIKHATKALHGIRPMFLLINTFKMLANQWQCELLGLPHKAQGKYRLSARSKILFNYDAFWQENQGKYRAPYWQLPLIVKRKALDDVASKKRAMYRKRYDMLDAMQRALAVLLKNA